MLKPWGIHFPVLWGKQWKIKLLYFKRGGEISYQRHNHRAELWLFVFGRGKLRIGEKLYFEVSRGMAKIVERGEWHQYKSERPTLVIEIQFGGACLEDDIERRAT